MDFPTPCQFGLRQVRSLWRPTRFQDLPAAAARLAGRRQPLPVSGAAFRRVTLEGKTISGFHKCDRVDPWLIISDPQIRPLFSLCTAVGGGAADSLFPRRHWFGVTVWSNQISNPPAKGKVILHRDDVNGGVLSESLFCEPCSCPIIAVTATWKYVAA